ncbi:hypothetical protein [Pseudonocardia sp.]|uniref:hypothetical protein n=1 Tax=Pseudonocardia sp. TaxID=60912 RepID=UPI003D10DE92
MPDDVPPCSGCRSALCPDCSPTMRIPGIRIDPPTAPIGIRPEWLPGQWQPAPPTNGHDHELNQAIDDGGQVLRIAAATCSLAVLVSTGGLWATGNLLWLLGIMPGAVIAAAVVVGLAELVRRRR